MKEKAVGIVANPASGKDIRRIVTYSTPYGNQEKVNIIRRVLMALHATGIHKDEDENERFVFLSGDKGRLGQCPF